MKDNKDILENKPRVRLINPAKNEIGRISKVILEKINVAIKSQVKLNQWKNPKEVIDLFVSIDEKPLYKLVQFNIKEFYPSIKESHLEKASNFAEKYINISTDDKTIIKHARKSLLFNKRKMWMKKDSGLFDVAMDAFDGAEVCKLVGNFLLRK